MQEPEHELQTEDVPMNDFSNNFWLQIAGVHLCSENGQLLTTVVSRSATTAENSPGQD